MLTSREIASIFWLGVLLLWALTRRDARNSIINLLCAFLNWKILALLAVYAAYIVACIWVAARIGLWERFLLKGTIVWFLLSGFPLLFSSDEAGSDERFFLRTLRSVFALSAVAGFFFNVVSFSLAVELTLQPIIATLGTLIVVARTDKKFASAKKVLEVLSTIIGISLIVLTARDIYSQRHVLEFSQLWRSLALTIWLPAVVLPFLYLFALVARYELVFSRLGHTGSNPRIARLAVVVGLNGHIRDVHAFTGGWLQDVAEAPDLRSALLRVRGFRDQQSMQRAAERESVDRLRRYAGVDGADADGKRLDQRDFIETRTALRWLATCQMGWYRNHGNRYRSELLDILTGDSFGLPLNHGIVMRIRDDGQGWYAWRRTVGGWVFAIGAASEPPDQWLYDGPNPPTGYPGSNPNWDQSAPSSFAINW